MYNEVVFLIKIMVIALLVMLLGWITYSHFEQKAYNEVTGRKVTLFQAMFLELRVQESVK